jgi:hypothetical protein
VMEYWDFPTLQCSNSQIFNFCRKESCGGLISAGLIPTACCAELIL